MPQELTGAITDMPDACNARAPADAALIGSAPLAPGERFFVWSHRCCAMSPEASFNLGLRV